jgi:hypothetical protein
VLDHAKSPSAARKVANRRVHGKNI